MLYKGGEVLNNVQFYWIWRDFNHDSGFSLNGGWRTSLTCTMQPYMHKSWIHLTLLWIAQSCLRFFQSWSNVLHFDWLESFESVDNLSSGTVFFLLTSLLPSPLYSGAAGRFLVTCLDGHSFHYDNHGFMKKVRNKHMPKYILMGFSEMSTTHGMGGKLSSQSKCL